jgi:hypothetical protein
MEEDTQTRRELLALKPGFTKRMIASVSGSASKI